MSKIKIRCLTKAAWVWETDEVEVNVMLHGLKKTNGRKYFVCSGEAYIHGDIHNMWKSLRLDYFMLRALKGCYLKKKGFTCRKGQRTFSNLENPSGLVVQCVSNVWLPDI